VPKKTGSPEAARISWKPRPGCLPGHRLSYAPRWSRRAVEPAAGVNDAFKDPVVDEAGIVALAVALCLAAVLRAVHVAIGTRQMERGFAELGARSVEDLPEYVARGAGETGEGDLLAGNSTLHAQRYAADFAFPGLDLDFLRSAPDHRQNVDGLGAIPRYVSRHERDRTALLEFDQNLEVVGRHLERRGLLVRDAESAYLQWEDERSSPLDDLLGAAITYRIAVGPQRGQKAFTLQTLTPTPEDEKTDHVARTGGFSLHAGIAAKARQREKMERLCRYIARPAVVTERLSLTRQGDVRVALAALAHPAVAAFVHPCTSKTPYRDGTTHVVFQPLDFIARLAALVPRPRVNLTRFHGVFAPNSRYRAQITPAGRGRRRRTGGPARAEPQKRQAMTWAQRLKRVFRIDIETCEHCGGAVRVIAPAHPCAPRN